MISLLFTKSLIISVLVRISHAQVPMNGNQLNFCYLSKTIIVNSWFVRHSTKGWETKRSNSMQITFSLSYNIIIHTHIYYIKIMSAVHCMNKLLYSMHYNCIYGELYWILMYNIYFVCLFICFFAFLCFCIFGFFFMVTYNY